MGLVDTSESVLDRPVVTVDIYSDVVCPWCYIGKRKFEAGLAEAGDLGVQVEVRYHAFQLDPTAEPGVATPAIEGYAKKFGGPERAEQIVATVTERAAEAGIEFHMDRALRANTLRAHRLIWWAGEPGSPVDQAVLKERLLQAYFSDGLNIGDYDVLADCAAEVGFDRDDAYDFVTSNRGTAEVAAELEAANDQGITAVPTYVLNGRWAVPGAQEPATYAQVLRKLAQQAVDEASTRNA